MKLISVNKVILDKNLWPRFSLNRDLVKLLVELLKGNEMFHVEPIVLSSSNVLIDGWGRFVAYKLAGRHRIPFIWEKTDDVFRSSIRRNARVKTPLTRAELDNAIIRLSRRYPVKVIAGDTGVSVSHVEAVLDREQRLIKTGKTKRQPLPPLPVTSVKALMKRLPKTNNPLGEITTECIQIMELALRMYDANPQKAAGILTGYRQLFHLAREIIGWEDKMEAICHQ